MKPNQGDEGTAQSGMTLVELIVMAAISAVVLAVVASLFATELRANSVTTDRDTATAKVQTISMTLQTSIRNAREGSVSSDGRALTALVSTGSGWACRQWALSGGNLTYRASRYSTVTVLANGVSGTLNSSGAAFILEAGTTNTFSFGVQVTVGQASAQADGTETAEARTSEVGGETC